MRTAYLLKQLLLLPVTILAMWRRQLPRAFKLSNRKSIQQRLLFSVLMTAILITAFIFFKFHGKIKPMDCKSWKMNAFQHKTTLITKRPCLRHYYLLIVVSSAPANFEKRHLIRQTWGTDNNNNPQWMTFFLVGQTTNQTHSALLLQEEKSYGDIIRGDYFEGYYKQSFKIEMGFEWAARYCQFSFLLKSDDDVFVNTKRLTLFLQQASTPKKSLYMGKVQDKAFAQRNNASKHFISYEEYTGVYLPPFCSGGGYVLSYDVVECFVSLFNDKNRFRLDDVYVGLLAKKIGVTAVHHRSFNIPEILDDKCDFLPNTVLQHRAVGQCLIKLYKMHSQFNYT